MTRSQADLLAACIDSNTPVMLLGAPGTAKTATIEALASQRGSYLEVVIASQHDPTTILGIPMPSADRKHTEATIPGWARRINEADARGESTILFLDELSTVPPIVVGPLLGVVQSRRAEGWTLPAATRIIAAANPADMAPNGQSLAPAMANRWVHITWTADAAAWCQWASASESPTLRLLSEYIEAMPEALLAVPNDIKSRSGAWPSPRSWTNGAGLVDTTGQLADMELAVGQLATRQFMAWHSTRDIPTVEALLAGKASLPQRPDAFRTCVNNLADSVRPDTLADTLRVLRAGIAQDAGLVAESALRIARAGHVAGISELVADLRAAGIDFSALALAADGTR